MRKGLKNWQGTVCIIGVDWGDSGKGRLVDDLSSRADIVARYAGGANTGHTVENKFGKFAFHIMPSGIFNEKAICLVGRNVAVDLESLIAEMEQLDKAGISYRHLVIDGEASVTMPWHKIRESKEETLRGSGQLGTTSKGVGQTYADRTARIGLLVKDLVSRDFPQKLRQQLDIQNALYNLNLGFEEIYKKYNHFAKVTKSYIGNTIRILKEAKAAGKNILFEGAQGYFLDIDGGTYPFVTSSHPGVLGIWSGFDLHPSEIDESIGITKAYMTRVGIGPMPTKIETQEGKIIAEKGKEFGTTTGRPRAPGWLDLMLMKEAVKVNKITSLAITKLDVLSGFKTLKLCVDYQIDGEPTGYVGHDSDHLAKCVPVYEELSGWDEDISNVRTFAALPRNAKRYLAKIEEFAGVPVKFISVGPKRGEAIYV